MPIKWNITAKAMKARGIMDQVSAEYDGFIEAGSEHLADVKGLRSQVGEMHDDLHAAANVMGNAGGAGSGANGSTEVKEPAKVPPPDPPPVTFQPLPDLPTARQMAFGRDVADPAPSHQPGS